MKSVRIGMVGSGFMCRAHSLAYQSAHAYWPELPLVELVRVADVDVEAAHTAVERFGWAQSTTEWTAVTRATDVDVVDIVTPNDTHASIALDAIAHGKHVVCEKPLANTVTAARNMRDAAVRAGIIHQVNFVYRRWPAIAFAKELIAQGKIGRVLHFEGHYLQEHGLDRRRPMSWRFDRAIAGAGSIGDIGSHLIDIARYLMGDVGRVSARTRTVVTERQVVNQTLAPRQEGRVVMARVEVDDSCEALLEFVDGATGTLRTSWAAAGHRNDLGFEVSGELGALRFGWPHPNELQVLSAEPNKTLQGWRSVIIGAQHPGGEAFWPAGQGIGWTEGFLLAARDMLESLQSGTAKSPNFEDGLKVNEVIDAIQRSAAELRWVDTALAEAEAPV